MGTSTEVVKPKDRSMRSTSLSMVLGMPTTATFICRRTTSSEMVYAPRWVPSPPTTYKWLNRSRFKNATIASMSNPPRDDANSVPPWWWMSATLSTVSWIGSNPFLPLNPA